MDLQDKMVTARREGREEGKAEGREEGEAKGLVKGEAKKQAEIARNALREGVPIDLIQKITGLDSATISQLSLKG
jgi:predicted transposase/invertase (TIGR01784 family)